MPGFSLSKSTGREGESKSVKRIGSVLIRTRFSIAERPMGAKDIGSKLERGLPRVNWAYESPQA